MDWALWEPLVTVTGVVSGSGGDGLLPVWQEVRMASGKTEAADRDDSPGREASPREEQTGRVPGGRRVSPIGIFLFKMGSVRAC